MMVSDKGLNILRSADIAVGDSIAPMDIEVTATAIVAGGVG